MDLDIVAVELHLNTIQNLWNTIIQLEIFIDPESLRARELSVEFLELIINDISTRNNLVYNINLNLAQKYINLRQQLIDIREELNFDAGYFTCEDEEDLVE